MFVLWWWSSIDTFTGTLQAIPLQNCLYVAFFVLLLISSFIVLSTNNARVICYK